MFELLGRESGERFRDDGVHDELAFDSKSFALLGQSVLDRAAGAGHAFDQSAIDHARRQGAEGLIGLKSQNREIVQRGIRASAEVPQRVPLHERESERGQRTTGCPMMAVLEPLHGQRDL